MHPDNTSNVSTVKPNQFRKAESDFLGGKYLDPVRGNRVHFEASEIACAMSLTLRNYW